MRRLRLFLFLFFFLRFFAFPHRGFEVADAFADSLADSGKLAGPEEEKGDGYHQEPMPDREFTHISPITDLLANAAQASRGHKKILGYANWGVKKRPTATANLPVLTRESRCSLSFDETGFPGGLS